MHSAESIVNHCRQGGTLHKEFFAYASGRSEVGFSLQPGGERVPTHCAQQPSEEDNVMNDKAPIASVVKLKKPSFSEKFKSKNAPTISAVETLLTALPVLKIGDVDDWTRLHPSEDDYWSPELCFVSVPIKGATRDTLHLIDDDLAVEYLPAKKIKRHRLALACKPHDVFFFCIEPSQNLDNAYNADALKACHKAQTHWIQALSRRSEGAEGYEIKLGRIKVLFLGRNGRRVC
jgi:hypothetical protein